MRKVAASRSCPSTVPPGSPDEFVTDVDDATEENLGESDDDHRHHRL